jgi:hypothetical protein
VPAEPEHVYWLDAAGDGELKRQEAEPAPRAHTARDLTAVIQFALREGAGVPAVWYSRAGVVCLTDDGTRRDRVTLPLGFSPQLTRLLEWERTTTPLQQAAAVLALRTLFDGCCDASLLAVLRAVKFETRTGGTGEVQHGKRSIGQSLEASITGADVIPEYTVFRVPLFAAGLPHADSIRCAVEPNPGQASVTFLPLPGMIEAALAAAERAVGLQLADALAEAKVPVYYGSP